MTQSHIKDKEPEKHGTVQTGFWDKPWSYPQTLTVGIFIVGGAMIIQSLYPGVRVELPGPPWNWVFLLAPLSALMICAAIYPQNTIISGLGGIPFSCISIVLLCMTTLPAAIWPTGSNMPEMIQRLGSAHVFSSFGFVAALLCVMLNLSIAIGRRLHRITRVRNTRFLLVHMGLLIAIASACAGTASFQRVWVPTIEGEPFSNLGYRDNQEFLLPFELRLIRFELDNYPPTLGLAVRENGESWDITPGAAFLTLHTEKRIGPYHVRVLEVIERARFGFDGIIPHESHTAGPAVRVAVYQGDTLLTEGWLHAKTPHGHDLHIDLSDNHVLFMVPPKPRRYASTIEVRSDAESPGQEIVVVVNAPPRVNGWRLYQMSYDFETQPGHVVSILEANRDPAYPGVVIGCLLLLAGVIAYLWDAAQLLRHRESFTGDIP